MIEFKNNSKRLTFGVEVELQVLDRDTLDLVPRAGDLISKTSINHLAKELFQSTIELITPVLTTVDEADDFFEQKFSVLQEEGFNLGLCFSSTGTHPFANYTERLITPSPRYQFIVSKNRWLIRRMAVYGMHIHLGMKSGEECIKFHNFFMRFLPHLIALSASSPFWHGLDTELSACRPTMYEALPTSGIPYYVQNWVEYQHLISKMMKFDSIRSFKDIWWDIRPSPELGTLEIRICDNPASRKELIAIVGFVQILGFWFADHLDLEKYFTPLPLWMVRENKWRAIRDGLNASIILPDESGVRSTKDDLIYWMDLLRPYYVKMNYERYFGDLLNIVYSGNSSMRQTAKFRDTDSLYEVVKMNVAEFYAGHPD